MRRDGLERWRLALRLASAAVFIPFGIFHVRAPNGFMRIMPPQIPYPREVVIATGVAEILGGIGLLIPRTRKPAAVGLALYAVGVYPANLYHAFAHVHIASLPDSWWYHVPRLLCQPVFVWWALFAGGLLDWPFNRATDATVYGADGAP
jgi:uncharacterized membrane protein